MAFEIDDKGNITCIQGDDGKLTINGLPVDKNYTLYFAIQDKNRKPIGTEISVSTNRFKSAVFSITSSLTDLLTVKNNEDTATYYYGIKLCDSATGLEDTLLLGNSKIGDVNTITVYPKKVEGTK